MKPWDLSDLVCRGKRRDRLKGKTKLNGEVRKKVERRNKREEWQHSRWNTSKRFQRASSSSTLSNIQTAVISYEYIIWSFKSTTESAATRTRVRKQARSQSVIHLIKQQLLQLCRLKSAALMLSSTRQPRLPFIFTSQMVPGQKSSNKLLTSLKTRLIEMKEEKIYQGRQHEKEKMALEIMRSWQKATI